MAIHGYTWALTKKTSYIRNLMLNKVPQACVLVEFVNEQVFKNTRKIGLLHLESQEQIFIITPPRLLK